MAGFTTDYKEYKEYLDKEYFRRAPEFPLTKCMRRTGTSACIAVILLFMFFFSPFRSATSTMFTSHNALFPRKVWQTWKVDPLDFAEKDLTIARSWPGKNPAFRYEVLTDQNDMAWVETNFGPDGFNRLDIVYVYRELTAKIIKADLLRYLIMYAEGGVYADIDVEALRSVKNFIPERWDERNVDMVIGIEIDQPGFKDHPILGKKSQSFCQWTFMCKPRLRVMMDLVENIMDWLKAVAAEQKVPISEIKLDFDQVIMGTGPSAFTKAILADMSRRTGRGVDWGEFHNLAESKLVGDVLVLTVEAFAAGQGHSDSGNHDTKHALVRHHYHASKWPDAHPRYKHPIFGQVEDCNWKPECVKQWDEDKATFEALGPAEQAKQIEIHEAEEAKRVEKEKIEEAKLEQIRVAEELAAANRAAFDAASPEVQAKLAWIDPTWMDRAEKDRAAFDVLTQEDQAKLAALDAAAKQKDGFAAFGAAAAALGPDEQARVDSPKPDEQAKLDALLGAAKLDEAPGKAPEQAKPDHAGLMKRDAAPEPEAFEWPTKPSRPSKPEPEPWHVTSRPRPTWHHDEPIKRDAAAEPEANEWPAKPWKPEPHHVTSRPRPTSHHDEPIKRDAAAEPDTKPWKPEPHHTEPETHHITSRPRPTWHHDEPIKRDADPEPEAFEWPTKPSPSWKPEPWHVTSRPRPTHYPGHEGW